MTPDAQATQLLLVDDHPAVREGLALLLASEGFAICGEAGSRAEALARIAECPPTLVVLDLSLGEEDGLELLPDLRAGGIPALVYSTHGDVAHVEQALKAGALGYVTKSDVPEVLVQALREVAAGRRFVSPHAGRALAEGLGQRGAGETDPELSEQERRVYSLLGRGEGTLEIAAALRISGKTVESYYARILDKLGLETMRELRQHAVRQNNSS
jgi:two-component system, NarL family, invasion response regulator UvrY